MYYACIGGYENMVKTLLKYNFMPNAKVMSGETPCDVAENDKIKKLLQFTQEEK